MSIDRRKFIKSGVVAGAGIAATLYGLEHFYRHKTAAKFFSRENAGLHFTGDLNKVRYHHDSLGLCRVPEGFTAKGFSRRGDLMSDGTRLPGMHDGMACFANKNVTQNTGHELGYVLVRNHEIQHEDVVASPLAQFAYDTNCNGGVSITTLNSQLEVVDQRLGLTGTVVNCSGGKTPWNAWLSCEETSITPESQATLKDGAHVLLKHGYVFEVDPFAPIKKGEPLRAMGRFRHEAAVVDPDTGVVYLTEDEADSCLYRFTPKVKGQLQEGGVLEALKVGGLATTQRTIENKHVRVGEFGSKQKIKCEWVRIEDPDPSQGSAVRQEAHSKGATAFARLEGAVREGRELYFDATVGGRFAIGQIFKISIADLEHTSIELVYEAHDRNILQEPDQLTFNNFGDLIICEDPGGGDEERKILGLRPDGKLYTIAHTTESEWSGVTFSLDYQYLFANIQGPGITYALSGDWAKLRASAI